MATFRCVLCLRELPTAEQTDEHVFPEAIGGVVVLKDMCKLGLTRSGGRVGYAAFFTEWISSNSTGLL
jgi:hypothetical protein